MAKLVKATDVEKLEYQKSSPVYPLYGYAMVGDKKVIVEDLRGAWSNPDPVWELFTTPGYVFAGDWLHNMLFHTLKEVKDYLKTAKLEQCDRPCGWCGAK